MTEKQFEKLKFKCTGHVTLEDYHISTYQSDKYDVGFRLICPTFDNPIDEEEIKEYYYDGKYYDNREAFFDAISEVKF